MTSADDRVLADRDDEKRREAEEHQSFVRHELRTPLSVMRPLLDLLLDGQAGRLDERQLGYMRMLDRSVDRLAAMITSLAESGWLETAAVPEVVAAVATEPLVREVVAEASAALDEHPRVRTDMAPELPALSGDPVRLRRALRNVVLNACRYTPSTGSVVVTASAADDGAAVLLTVTDTGPGIEEDEIDQVFDFGFLGKAARERPDRGLGLGLFVTRDVVTALGGRVWLESAPGEGTRASLELPAASASATP
jgi:signal transduction histidine kinase